MGMGKTKLIKEVIKAKLELMPYLNVYHLDTKKQGDFSPNDGTFIRSEVPPLPFTTGGNRMVWQPMEDDIEHYSHFFTRILQAGLPSIVNIDESKNMVFNGKIPRGLNLLLSQGRLPGIDVIGGTQEVAQSPRQMLSQASHLICFNIINDYDVRIMKSQLKLPKGEELDLKKYELLYRRPDIDDYPMKLKSYEELLHFIK